MNYGGESGRDYDGFSGENGTSGGDDFVREISRIAVAQVCQLAGFQSAQCSALDTLADAVIRYMCDLGKTAHFYTGLSGRTCCNVFDVIQGLQDMRPLDRFPSALDAHHCHTNSVVVRDIIQYVRNAEECPFARSLPHFPVVLSRKPALNFAMTGEIPPGNHIPSWLPPFPDQHTYFQTPVWSERASDPKADKIEQAKQRRKAERSLLSLQQRLASSGTRVFIPINEGGSGEEKKIVDVNLSLPSPLPSGEREVSPPFLSDETSLEKKVSVFETFVPIIEAIKNGPLDIGENENIVLPSKRPAVYFKFGIDKKTLAGPFSLYTPASAKTASWLSGTDEKDDKKRRAQLILRESMDNPQELHQL